MPSPSTPSPVTAEALDSANGADISAKQGPPAADAARATYFWGGFSCRRYGVADSIPAEMGRLPAQALSGWARRVASISLETSWAARADEDARRAFASALCDAARQFVKEWAPPVEA